MLKLNNDLHKIGSVLCGRRKQEERGRLHGAGIRRKHGALRLVSSRRFKSGKSPAFRHYRQGQEGGSTRRGVRGWANGGGININPRVWCVCRCGDTLRGGGVGWGGWGSARGGVLWGGGVGGGLGGWGWVAGVGWGVGVGSWRKRARRSNHFGRVVSSRFPDFQVCCRRSMPLLRGMGGPRPEGRRGHVQRSRFKFRASVQDWRRSCGTVCVVYCSSLLIRAGHHHFSKGNHNRMCS